MYRTSRKIENDTASCLKPSFCWKNFIGSFGSDWNASSSSKLPNTLETLFSISSLPLFLASRLFCTPAHASLAAFHAGLDNSDRTLHESSLASICPVSKFRVTAVFMSTVTAVPLPFLSLSGLRIPSTVYSMIACRDGAASTMYILFTFTDVALQNLGTKSTRKLSMPFVEQNASLYSTFLDNSDVVQTPLPRSISFASALTVSSTAGEDVHTKSSQ
mmetsp:Transcript_9819/g.26728  ORF Transcript_9819/g.26728 Transcript_9819/m.26728 type:complete len:217 (+) Transcript_9819:121-771(+)